MSDPLLRRRRALIDGVIDLESAIAASAILLRLTDQLPAEFLDRLRALHLLDPVRTHFARLHEEPDYDQVYACARILNSLQTGGSLIALLGPGGSGKTWALAYQILAAIRAWLTEQGEAADSVQVTSPTNQGVNVLRRRGVNAITNHVALYALSFGPSVEIVQRWLIEGGIGQLPEDVSPRLPAAWRHAQPGPRERAQHKAKNNLMEAALRELGLMGGFMDILPPRWRIRDELTEAPPISVWIVDEAAMMTSQTLEDIQKLARFVLPVGDPFQLPTILEESEIMRGITGALSRVPLGQQVHLHRDRRTRGENQHLRAAAAILKDSTSLRDIDRWAANGEIPGLRSARRFDMALMAQAPALGFYRNTVIRLSVQQRRAAQLPDDQLVPGERLLIESIARDRRDQLNELGIHKNSRVIVLKQTTPYEALIIAEHTLEQLRIACEAQGREPRLNTPHRSRSAFIMGSMNCRTRESRQATASPIGGCLRRSAARVSTHVSAAQARHIKPKAAPIRSCRSRPTTWPAMPARSTAT